MRATEELRKEHQGVELMLQILQAVANRMGRGEEIPVEDLDGILSFLKVFVDQCHHGKEEEHLFPAMASVGVPQDDGPIGVMLHEHELGRALVSRLRDAVTVLQRGDGSIVPSIQAVVAEDTGLLILHIDKENRVLFPMADARLDAAVDQRLCEAFELLERERIGMGRHEQFHELLHRLRHTYLR